MLAGVAHALQSQSVAAVLVGGGEIKSPAFLDVSSVIIIGSVCTICKLPPPRHCPLHVCVERVIISAYKYNETLDVARRPLYAVRTQDRTSKFPRTQLFLYSTTSKSTS